MSSQGALHCAGGAQGALSTPASVSAPALLMRSALKTGGSVTKKVSWDPAVAHQGVQVRDLSCFNDKAEWTTVYEAVKDTWMPTFPVQ